MKIKLILFIAIFSLLLTGCAEIVTVPLSVGIGKTINRPPKVPPAELEKKWWNRDEEIRQNEKRAKIILLNIDSPEYKKFQCTSVMDQTEKSFYLFNDKPEQKELLINKLKDLAIQINVNAVMIEKIDSDTIYAKILNCN
jgi:hypothetical protein